MKLNILDTFHENGATCHLCRTTLGEYIGNLPEDYREFFVQRGIVTNRFLDNLTDTLIHRRHIPSIVLVAEPPSPVAGVGESFELDARFRILDGLQRSHRLREIWETVRYIDTAFQDDGEPSLAKTARRKSSDLKSWEISSSVFQRVLGFKRDGGTLGSLFTDNHVWLEVWFNLTEAQQIQKMLILNAGHKSVNIKHQIELLFWGNFANFQSALAPARIVREKEKSSMAYSKGRQQREFHFAHIVSAFVSLTDGSAVSTNADFSAAKSFDEDGLNEEGFIEIDDEILKAFARTLNKLDNTFKTDEGVRWLGREVVLVGIFGAIGNFAKTAEISVESALEQFTENVEQFAEYMALGEFERARNRLELSKVNIGNENKRAILEATTNFLNGQKTGRADWHKLFRLADDV